MFFEKNSLPSKSKFSPKTFEAQPSWNLLSLKFKYSLILFVKGNWFIIICSCKLLIEILRVKTLKLLIEGSKENTLILEGGNDYLSEKKIKSISVEVNKNFKEQLEKINKILEKCNFIFSSSNYSPDNPNRNIKNRNTENFIFNKKL